MPEDQRAVIGMYYYEEMSVKEIASSMSASESAVKSRLMYARKKIEVKVRELEKNGTKLYGLAPLPFLLQLFKYGKAGNLFAQPDKQMLSHVIQAAGVTGASTAGGLASSLEAGTAAAGTATGLGVGKIIAIVAAVIAVWVGAMKAEIFGHNYTAATCEQPATCTS